MWESPIYKFEKEVSEKGKILKKPFEINVTYSVPRSLFDPGNALMGVFEKITKDKDPEKIQILDFGAGKFRNTLWLLQKGFTVHSVEFKELGDRLDDAKEKWKLAKTFQNFKPMVFPGDFIDHDKKFDIILLINVFNVMPIPAERFALLCLLRGKIKNKGTLLWHQWRGLATGQDKYTDENAFIDGYLMGQKKHTFYVERTREQTFEILSATGFSFNKDMNLHKIPGNSGYSYVFNPTHEILIDNALEFKSMIKKKHNPNEILITPEPLDVLELYKDSLKITPGLPNAHKYHRLAARIFYQIFDKLVDEPIIEREINETRGRIDITYKNKNKEGIFKSLFDLRKIPCPQIIVECKNYSSELEADEYNQILSRLNPHRGKLGFLLCRDKIDKNTVIKHCHDRYKGEANNYIIVLDDKDLKKLADLRINENFTLIDNFIEEKILEIVD